MTATFHHVLLKRRTGLLRRLYLCRRSCYLLRREPVYVYKSMVLTLTVNAVDVSMLVNVVYRRFSRLVYPRAFASSRTQEMREERRRARTPTMFSTKIFLSGNLAGLWELYILEATRLNPYETRWQTGIKCPEHSAPLSHAPA